MYEESVRSFAEALDLALGAVPVPRRVFPVGTGIRHNEERLLQRAVVENASIRAHVENVVFPPVRSLGEEKRGEIERTDDARQRINKAASGPAW